jgi:hypothetical protein
MNIAFPALLIFLFILPGFIFNLAFYKTENTPLKYISLTHKTIISSTFTIVLHLAGLIFITYLFHDSLNISLILTLVSGLQGDKFAAAISSITNHEIIYTSSYLIIIYIIAYLAGKLFRFIIRHFRLDKKFNLFRIDSPWYYLFTGYDWDGGKPDGVRIAAIIEIANKGYLYVGWLYSFYLDNNGGIERLILTSAEQLKMIKRKKMRTH